MPMTAFGDWLQEHAEPDRLWYVKRLSANDTLANKTHQAGPYIPRQVLFSSIPELNKPETHNPDVQVDARIDSHADRRPVRAVWYNGRQGHGGTRNEARITNWGGKSSPILDPDSTGSVAVFVFHVGHPVLNVWICGSGIEEDRVEERFGDISAGRTITWRPGHEPEPVGGPQPCSYNNSTIPREWKGRFPSALELVQRSVALRPLHGRLADERLLIRRQCEFGLFQSLEHLLEMPRVANGFSSLDEFTDLAQTILQRRKSRAGLSFEYQTRTVLEEEGFVEGRTMSFKPRVENGKEPDLLFPSASAYNDPSFPASRLRMLGLKTTLRDRWRQVLNEASRIGNKHILTLQDSLSEAQFREMREANITLVVPETLREGYPASIRDHLMTLQDFIADLRMLGTIT